MNLAAKNNTDVRNRKWQILNATTLKLFAVSLMFLDHVHEMFVSMGAPMWLTMAGSRPTEVSKENFEGSTAFYGAEHFLLSCAYWNSICHIITCVQIGWKLYEKKSLGAKVLRERNL